MNIVYSNHARENMEERGVTEEEIEEVLRTGSTIQGQFGRQITTKVLAEGYERRGRRYPHKEVQLIHITESGGIIIVTVKTRYGRFEETT